MQYVVNLRQPSNWLAGASNWSPLEPAKAQGLVTDDEEWYLAFREAIYHVCSVWDLRCSDLVNESGSIGDAFEARDADSVRLEQLCTRFEHILQREHNLMRHTLAKSKRNIGVWMWVTVRTLLIWFGVELETFLLSASC